MRIPKIVRAAGILAIIAIVATIASSTIMSADLLSSFATGSERLTPDGIPAGKALVAYNPGLSGASKDAATRIAAGLQSAGYEVVLAGISSPAAANLSGYDIIVVGGPIYSGKVSSSVRSYLNTMHPPAGATIGAFATGSLFKDYVTEPFPDASAPDETMLLFNGDDVSGKCAGFVDVLLK